MSLQTALTGLNGAQTGLDTVSNDLANASTTAFKSQTAEFADIYPSGSSNVPGLGVTTSSMDTDFAQGAPVSTGNPFDAAIQGNGFFIVDQGGQQEYTRDGSFELNGSDQLVSAATGAQVMGIQPSGALGPITVNTGAMPASATTTSTLAFNLDSNTTAATTDIPGTTTPYAYTYPVTTYDSLGNANTVDLYFVPGTTGSDTYTVYAEPVSTGTNTASVTGAVAATTAPATPGTGGQTGTATELATLNFNSAVLARHAMHLDRGCPLGDAHPAGAGSTGEHHLYLLPGGELGQRRRRPRPSTSTSPARPWARRASPWPPTPPTATPPATIAAPRSAPPASWSRPTATARPRIPARWRSPISSTRKG